jgi:hypothetical protein
MTSGPELTNKPRESKDEADGPALAQSVELSEPPVTLRNKPITLNHQTIPLNDQTIPLNDQTIPLNDQTIPLNDPRVIIAKRKKCAVTTCS